MSDELDTEFEEIAEKAIAKASAVKCTLGEFREGLKTMQDAIRARIEQVEDELRSR